MGLPGRDGLADGLLATCATTLELGVVVTGEEDILKVETKNKKREKREK